MNKRLQALFCIVLLAAIPALPSQAQELIELRGVVSDETGAAIVAATVIIEGQGQKSTLQTNEQGQYRIARLQPGAYTLTVNARGFAAFTSQLQLGAERAAAVNVTLTITLAEQEEVRADTDKVSTGPDKNLSGITLTSKDLDALPDDPDEMLAVLRQMAGATCKRILTVFAVALLAVSDWLSLTRAALRSSKEPDQLAKDGMEGESQKNGAAIHHQSSAAAALESPERGFCGGHYRRAG